MPMPSDPALALLRDWALALGLTLGLALRTLTLRALVSSAGSARNWDLRCLVRERLVCYIQEKHPDILPLTRISLDKPEPQDPKEMEHG